MTGWKRSWDTNDTQPRLRRDDLPRRNICEESPDRKGHFTAESADRGNLMDDVTENNRILRMQG